MVAVGVLVVVFTIFNKADGQAQDNTPKGPKVTEKVSYNVPLPCRLAICQTLVIAFLPPHVFYLSNQRW